MLVNGVHDEKKPLQLDNSKLHTTLYPFSKKADNDINLQLTKDVLVLIRITKRYRRKCICGVHDGLKFQAALLKQDVWRCRGQGYSFSAILVINGV